MSVNSQLLDIQKTLATHGESLRGIDKKMDQTRENTTKLFDEAAENGKDIARLQERADSFERRATVRGTVSGGLIGGIIIGIRMGWEWLAGR